MAGATIKLMTNIPVIGTPEYVDYIPTKNPDYKDQIAIRGKWHVGEGRIYLPLPLEAELTKIGLIGAKQQNGNYPLRLTGARIKLLKTENGNSKITSVEVLSQGAAAAAPTQAPQQTTLYDKQPAQTVSGKDQFRQIVLTYKSCLKE